MNFRRAACLVIGLLFIFCALPLYAKSTGVVTARLANVRSGPTTRSEVLMKVRKGQKVQVLSKKGSWFKVRVKVDANFTFDGWMSKGVVRVKKYSTVKSTKKKKTRRSRAKVAPTKRRSKPSQSRPRSRTITQDRREFAGGRGDVSAGLSYRMYNYTLNNGGATPGTLFSYNLPGMGIDLQGKYWFLNALGGKLQLGAGLNFDYTMYSHKTNLQDSSVPPATFKSVSTKSSSYDIKGSFLTRYVADLGAFESFTLGLGYEYFKFSADDVQSNSGPLNLYTSQATSSLLAALNFHFFFSSIGLTTDLGGDILFLNWAKESPSGATGDSPKAKMGIIPRLTVGYQLAKKHNVSLGYALRMQKTSFTGTGTRVGSTVTDGQAKVNGHQLGLGYTYQF